MCPLIRLEKLYLEKYVFEETCHQRATILENTLQAELPPSAWNAKYGMHPTKLLAQIQTEWELSKKAVSQLWTQTC